MARPTKKIIQPINSSFDSIVNAMLSKKETTKKVEKPTSSLAINPKKNRTKYR